MCQNCEIITDSEQLFRAARHALSDFSPRPPAKSLSGFRQSFPSLAALSCRYHVNHRTNLAISAASTVGKCFA